MPGFPNTISIPIALRQHLYSSVSRLELVFDPRVGVARFRKYKFDFRRETLPYAGLSLLALFSLAVMRHPMLFKLFLVTVYTLALLIPFTSQFFVPATPIFSWLLFFYSSQFIPKAYRPHIWVSVLPTLESVLYGANISDILTRWTNSTLDILAWMPYGVGHFVIPFVVAAFIFVFGPPGAVKYFAKAFGYLNITGVAVQILFPCAPPWYELLHGLVPANYDMGGSPGGLARIDAIFHSNGYTKTFTGAPVPFGAFPSLHAGNATIEALFLSHFFPNGRPFWWAYVLWLYWSTMYLTHHYLVDLVAGGSLAVVSFFFFQPEEFRHLHQPASSSTPALNSIPLDVESGKKVTQNGSGHPDSYGGWEDDEDDEAILEQVERELGADVGEGRP